MDQDPQQRNAQLKRQAEVANLQKKIAEFEDEDGMCGGRLVQVREKERLAQSGLNDLASQMRAVEDQIDALMPSWAPLHKIVELFNEELANLLSRSKLNEIKKMIQNQKVRHLTFAPQI
jgi:hypothetical protein